MKWIFENYEAGDIVRVRIGSVYHYGIFVSQNEIIQFGYPPDYYIGEHANEEKKVCMCDVYSFMSGGILEKGVLDKNEKKLAFKPREIIQRAKSRLGEGGYNLIHNNCEHFVYECVFGIKRSLQEEEIRNKWKQRSVVDVYILTEELDNVEIYPQERAIEIESVANERLRREKTDVWGLLEIAIRNTFRYEMKDIQFTKQNNGKWIADKFCFSLSHSCGVCVVVVSDKPCGIDVENKHEFPERFTDKSFAESFAKAIGCRKNIDEYSLLNIWTRKESIFKARDEKNFVPKRISENDKNTRTFSFDNFIVSVTSESPEKIVFRKVENGKPKLYVTEEIVCQ